MSRIYESPAGPLKDLYYGNAVTFLKQSPNVAEKGDKPLYIDAISGTTITANGLFKLVGQVHSVLTNDYGLKYDDVLCTFLPNSVYYPALLLGIFSFGGIATPANPTYLPSELAHQLNTSGAKILITIPQLEKSAKEALASADASVKIVMIEDIIKKALRAPVAKEIELKGESARDKHLVYCFSSGTTGFPKAVVTSHQNMTSNLQQLAQTALASGQPARENVVAAALLPIPHIYGFSMIVFQLLWRCDTSVLFQAFDFELLLKSIVKYKITDVPAVPPIVLLLAKSPLVEKYPEVKTNLRRIYSGAAPLSKSLAGNAEQRLKNSAVLQGYGMTETSPTTHTALWNVDNYTQGSIGWLIAGQFARIVDPSGNDVEPGKPGELWIKGPNVMIGYLKNEKATKDTLTSDRWLKTGDVAVIDKSGQFYIVDRVKELIKSKGLQVAPAELEGILLKHPNVADAAVIGVFSEAEQTELPRAFVVVTGNTDLLEIKKWFDGSVAKHKKLYGGIVALEAIPKSNSGKILRRVLRERKQDKVVGSSEARARL